MTEPRRQHQTGGSAALSELSMRFGGWFSNDKFGTYMARLQEPSGMSTQGGKQALQHIQMTDVEGDGPTVNVGWLNGVAKQGKVRTFDVLQQMHEQRYQRWMTATDLRAAMARLAEAS